jgi:hypothetical protein
MDSGIRRTAWGSNVDDPDSKVARKLLGEPILRHPARLDDLKPGLSDEGNVGTGRDIDLQPHLLSDVFQPMVGPTFRHARGTDRQRNRASRRL